MVKTENKPEENKTELLKLEPVKNVDGRGGVKGMHHGHLFSNTCTCGRCKKGQEKIRRELESKDKIVQEYLSNLSNDELFFVMPDELSDLIISKVDKLKEKYPGKNYREFMSMLMNDAVKLYLTSI